jgi:exonuclease VII small subunit
MKYLNKIITSGLVGVMALTLFAPLASAQTPIQVQPVGVVNVKSLKARDEQARTKYKNARQQYLKEVNFYKNARQEFLNARSKYRQFKNTENKKALEEKARNFLDKAVNTLIKRLEAMKNWVSNRRALPENERQAIVTEIDQDINWLKERVDKIQTASPAEIKEEAKKVREYWKNHRVKVKRITGQIWAARINFVLGKAEGVANRVESKIEDLKATGKDTTSLENWLNDFKQKIALAEEKYEAAKREFGAISSLADADRLFRRGHQLIKEADQYIREAHQKLIEIIREMKKG